MADLFDSLMDVETGKKIKPYHTVSDKSEKAIHTWLKDACEAIQSTNQSRHSKQKATLMEYLGNFRNMKSMDRDSYRYFRPENQFIINEFFTVTETKVAQLNKLQTAVDVLPANNEYQDVNAAKSVQHLVNYLKYVNNVDYMRQKVTRYALLFGDGYLFITWDPNKGDLHPAYIAAKQAGQQIPLISSDGTPAVDASGNPIYITKPLKVGDVLPEVEVPWRVLLEPTEDFCNVNYCFRIHLKNVEDLKKEYPHLAPKLKADAGNSYFDVTTGSCKSIIDDTVVYEFWHKKTEFVPEGAHILFTKDVILDSGELGYSHGDLPFVRLTNLDIPGQLHGVSYYEIIRPIQQMYNNVNTVIAKNIWLGSHAKWLMPRGAAKIEQLTNDNTIIQYQGPVPPTLVNYQVNSPDVYNWSQWLKEQIRQKAGIDGISFGEPPAGVTANVALQFLNEQENERATADIAKQNYFIEDMFKKMIAVAGDYYREDDGRLLRIMGKDNKHLIKNFSVANLQKSYDIRVKLGNALPESKAGKNARIVEIMQIKPHLLSDERWIELLEFGNTEKMHTLIHEAIRAADAENEDMRAGEGVPEPQVWEDHFAHWESHVKDIQGISFKELPPEIQGLFQDHIATHEFAMIEKAKENPLFEAKLAQLPLFPIFYRDGFIPMSREQKEAMVQGAANQGAPIPGMIPGEERVIDQTSGISGIASNRNNK